MRRFDLLVIGAGSGNSIIGPEHDDWDIAVIERNLFGGTCLNVGCIPSKMYVYAAELAELASSGPRLGVATRFAGADWGAIRDRIFGRIDPIAAAGRQYRIDLPNTTVYEGSARFTGPRQVEVDGEAVTADQIVIAAGARPAVPDIAGLEGCGYHTSDTIMRLGARPERLIVLGGGYIAAELGGVMGAFGSEVVFVIRGDGFLRNEDDDIKARFTEAYRRRFEVMTGTRAVSVARTADGVELEVVSDDGRGPVRRRIRGDALLVAAGRVPNSDTLNLAASGIGVDGFGYVVTDRHCRTGLEGVWALGDIANPVQLKHVANHEARVVRHNLTHPDDPISVDHRFIPHAVFGNPQIAAVGLTERDCRRRGVEYASHVQPYGSAAYGWAMEDADSAVKVIADAGTRKLLGAHIIGPQASTLIQQLVQGMHFDLTVDEMARGQYYIHPALSEVVEQALLEL